MQAFSKVFFIFFWRRLFKVLIIKIIRGDFFGFFSVGIFLSMDRAFQLAEDFYFSIFVLSKQIINSIS